MADYRHTIQEERMQELIDLVDRERYPRLQFENGTHETKIIIAWGRTSAELPLMGVIFPDGTLEVTIFWRTKHASTFSGPDARQAWESFTKREAT